MRKAGNKSIIIGEVVHHVAKKHCTDNKTNLRAFVEKLILEATAPKETKPKKK